LFVVSRKPETETNVLNNHNCHVLHPHFFPSCTGIKRDYNRGLHVIQYNVCASGHSVPFSSDRRGDTGDVALGYTRLLHNTHPSDRTTIHENITLNDLMLF
jgi:hypothetical protein